MLPDSNSHWPAVSLPVSTRRCDAVHIRLISAISLTYVRAAAGGYSSTHFTPAVATTDADTDQEQVQASPYDSTAVDRWDGSTLR